jgi:hypothetical protein
MENRMGKDRRNSLDVLFNEKVAQVYDTGYETKQGNFADSLEKQLVLEIGECNEPSLHR